MCIYIHMCINMFLSIYIYMYMYIYMYLTCMYIIYMYSGNFKVSI